MENEYTVKDGVIRRNGEPLAIDAPQHKLEELARVMNAREREKAEFQRQMRSNRAHKELYR